MAKIRLHIDPIGIEEKADEREWGRISRRVLKKDSIKEVTVAQLAQKLRTGHTVCPAILMIMHLILSQRCPVSFAITCFVVL